MAQIITNFGRKTLILNTKTHKFAPARMAQIMTSFQLKTLISNAKKPKFTLEHDNELMLGEVVAHSIEMIYRGL